MNTQPEVSAHTQALVAWFEDLKATDVAHMGAHYDTIVFFKDPFNEVNDLASVQAIFHEMFKRVHTRASSSTTCSNKGRPASSHGTSPLKRVARNRGAYGVPATCVSTRKGGWSTTAITGTPPRNYTKSCPSLAASCGG